MPTIAEDTTFAGSVTITGGQYDTPRLSIKRDGDAYACLTLEADGTILTGDGSAAPTTSYLSRTATYSTSGSHQEVAADLTLAAAAGSAGAGGDTDYLAAIMGNVLGADLTKIANYLAGLIGLYSVTGVKATTYPAGAVLAGIADGVTEADGAVVAYIDGDSAVTTAGAAFKVRNNNSHAASGFSFGLDLQDAAHDGYQAVDKDFYLSAPVRLVNDVVQLVGSGVPTNGVSGTGAGVAGPGSQYTDFTNANLYINGNTKASPTWKLVTRAA